jgi:uncharacterized protein YdaU (DUF1376 family)
VSGLDWFPFYVNDWLTSHSVRAMTFEERGAHLQLLIEAWADGGTIPDDSELLARLLGCDAGELEAWLQGPLGKLWPSSGDGRRSNGKLAAVLEEQQAKTARRRAAGKRGSANARSMPEQCSSNAQQCSSNAQQCSSNGSQIRGEEIRVEEKKPEGASAPTRGKPARRGRAKVKNWDAALEGDHADLLESHPAVVEWTAYLAERLPRAHQARTVENQIGKIRATPPEEFRRLVDLAIGSGWQGWHFPDRSEGPTTSAKACASVRERVDVRGAFESSFLDAQGDPAKLAALRSRLQAKPDLGAEDRADIGAVLDAADAGEPEAALARFCEKSRALHRGEEVSQ